MLLTPVFGTPQHQQMVMETLNNHSHYYPLPTPYDDQGFYHCPYFYVADPSFDYGLLESDCLEVFTDKVRVACATYLERKQQNNL
jgi:hypothetical protein